MPATVRINGSRVYLEVSESLSVDLWKAIKEASLSAAAEQKILNINVQKCDRGETGGIASILAAQQRLSNVELSGCHYSFVGCFKLYGVCDRCSQKNGLDPDCPKDTLIYSQTHRLA
jgi:hypothetical protein